MNALFFLEVKNKTYFQPCADTHVLIGFVYSVLLNGLSHWYHTQMLICIQMGFH